MKLIIHTFIYFFLFCHSVFGQLIHTRTQSATASCPPNIDFELGNFTNWETNTGEINTPLTFNVSPRVEGGAYNFINQDNVNWLKNAGLTGRQQLIDRNTNPPNDFYGGFPVNPPFGGGRYALKLGTDEPELDAYTSIPLPMSKTESARYRITVPPAPLSEDFSIVFAYAVVFEDPKNQEHSFYDRPSFRAYLYEPGGDTIDCLNLTFVATPNIPGFKTSTVKNPYSTDPNYSDVKYKEWTPVFVNLSKYPGKTLYVEFTTTDCTILGHFGYAYVDVIECNYKIKATGSCSPSNQTVLEGPEGPFQQYEWRSGDFNTVYGTGKNLTLNQALPANSTVKLIVTPYTGLGCRDTLTAIVQGATGPSVNLGTDKSKCGTQSVQIGVNPVTGYTYQWSPSIGLSSVNQSLVTANPNTNTTYTLTVTDPASGCSATDNIIINVGAPITISVNSGTICPGQNLTLTASGANTYSWSPTTGLSNSSGSSVTASPSTTTTYTVTGINSTTGCQATAQAVVTIQNAITINGRSVNPTSCVSGDGSIIISGLIPGTTYTINYQKDAVAQTPLTLTSNTAGEISINNVSAGTYQNINVQLNGCGSNNIGPFTFNNVVPDKPVLSAQSLTLCSGAASGNINFTTTGGAAVSWINTNAAIGLGATGSGNIGSFTALNNTASPIQADIKVKAVLNGCSSAEEVLRITVNPALVVVVNSPLVCAGSPVQLTANGADVYSWSPSTGLSSNSGATVTASPSATTTYTVTGINNTTGCRANAQATVTIGTIPIANITINGNSQFICEGSSVALNASGGNTYQWYFNNQPVAGATTSSLQATSAGTYSLEAISAQGCRSFASIRPTFQVINKPKADFTPPFGCLGNLVNFNNISAAGALNYFWDFGDKTNSTAFNPSHLYQTAGAFTVKLKVTSSVCTNFIDSVSKIVIIETSRTGIRYPAVNTLENTNTNLSARPIGSNYLWQPPVGLNTYTSRTPVFNYNQETEYLIRIGTASGCVIYDTILVRVAANTDIFVPEAFSPNNDGVNDFLEVIAMGAKKIHFWVFNRWGQLMFETTDPAQRWDGKFQGKPQPLENYVWIVEVETLSGRIIRKRGQTILIR